MHTLSPFPGCMVPMVASRNVDDHANRGARGWSTRQQADGTAVHGEGGISVGNAEVTARQARLALVPLLVGTFTGTISNTAVNVPIVDILADLDVPLSRGALVVVAFNLTFAVLMPLSGWLGDRLGRRRVFCAGMAGLAIGAVGASSSSGLAALVAFRALQGLATAALLPTVMLLIATMFAAERRGRALGAWAAVNGIGQAAGPAVGGVLAGWFGWRMIFWPTVPFALLALAGALWLVPRDAGRPVPLEWRGALLLTTGAGLVLGAATAVPPLGVRSPWVWVAAATGVIAALGYVAVERGRKRAFLPPGLLLEVRYLRSTLAVVAQMFTLGAALLGVPLYLIQERGLAVATAGLVVVVLPLIMAALAPIAGLATERLGGRRVLRAGLAVLLLGAIALTTVLATDRGPGPLLVSALAVTGAGIAFVQTPAATGATRSRAGATGAGLGLFNLMRFGGSALGAAWVAAVADVPGRWGVVFTVCAGVVAVSLAATFIGGEPGESVVPRGRRRRAGTAAQL